MKSLTSEWQLAPAALDIAKSINLFRNPDIHKGQAFGAANNRPKLVLSPNVQNGLAILVFR